MWPSPDEPLDVAWKDADYLERGFKVCESILFSPLLLIFGALATIGWLATKALRLCDHLAGEGEAKK